MPPPPPPRLCLVKFALALNGCNHICRDSACSKAVEKQTTGSSNSSNILWFAVVKLQTRTRNTHSKDITQQILPPLPPLAGCV